MKKRVIFILLALSMVVSSCVYTSMIRFSREDLLWMEAINVDKCWFFTSEDGQLDTLYFWNHVFSNKIFPMDFNPNHIGEPYHAYSYYYFGMKKCSQEREGFEPRIWPPSLQECRWRNGNIYFIKKDNKTLEMDIYINSCGGEMKIESLSSILIRGIQYDDCVLFLMRNVYPPDTRHLVDSVVWSRSKGLLKYTVDNQQIFYRKWD